MRIDGYLGGSLGLSETLSGLGVDQRFTLAAHDTELLVDGADATRVVVRVTDAYGAVRPYANDPISLSLEGPSVLLGEDPFSLVGGTGSVWLRAQTTAGTVRLTAKHARPGEQVVLLAVVPGRPEEV